MQPILQKNLQQSKSLVDALPKAVKDFYLFHGIQMVGSQMPTKLIEPLYYKLKEQMYDGGSYMQIIDNEEDEMYEVKATKNILLEARHVFIIDHALTFRLPELRATLASNQEIIARLESMLKYHSNKRSLPNQSQPGSIKQSQPGPQPESLPGPQPEPTSIDNIRQIQFDGLNLTDISILSFPPNLITLSLMNNLLQNQDELIKKLEYFNLKVLWLNGNPLAQEPKILDYINNKTKIQIYNSKFTKNCQDWGLKYAHNRKISFADSTSNLDIKVLNLDGRNIFAVKFDIFLHFTNLKSLSIKDHKVETEEQKKYLLNLLTEMKDLQYLEVDEEVERFVYQAFQDKLIPHPIASKILINKHSLLQKQLSSNDSKLDFISQNIMKIAGCYRLANTQQIDQSSCWYVNDELGSLLTHSDTPNCKIIPFLYACDNEMNQNVVAYSLLWPLHDILAGESLTVDYLHGYSEQKQRSSRLAIWYELPTTFYMNLIHKLDEQMLHKSKDSISLMQTFYTNNSIQQKQNLKTLLEEGFFEGKHRVISDYEYINKFLKHERFEIVSSLEEATIVWLTGAAQEEQWKKYLGKYFLNQFPFESCIVMKNNLAETIQSILGDTKFLMRTYNLETELPLMIGDYYSRQNEGLDNLWILKPPNMARSMDMVITDNLSVIIKSMETGPKIAQKYISQPVLRRGRKVDLRYILLVKSISPLTLYLYKNFWIRSSNNPYTIDRRHLSTYETQFTVMNYGKVSDFQQIPYKDFIDQFQKDYHPVKWATINDKIKKMLRNVFIAVGVKYPQMHSPKSRAVYGIDIMVDEQTMEPKLLEITFSPDCKRACEYYPQFYNEIFETLFLESAGPTMERII